MIYDVVKHKKIRYIESVDEASQEHLVKKGSERFDTYIMKSLYITKKSKKKKMEGKKL